MEDLVNLILQNDSPAQISDAIKDALSVKAMERIEAERPDVAANLFTAEQED
jgi:hypothetical protein